MKQIKVVCVDDHSLIRQAIRSLIDGRINMVLIGEGSKGADVFPLLDMHKPDVLLLDLSMPQDDDDSKRFQSLPTISKITENYDTKVIILTQNWVPALIQGVMRNGVNGYLLKSDDLSMNIPSAIESVSKGGVYFSETISQQLFAEQNGIGGSQLRERQIQVLSTIFDNPDASTKDMANTLGITEATVKSHLTKSFRVLGVSTRTAALIRCLELGIFQKKW